MTANERAYDLCNRIQEPGWGDAVTKAIADAIREAVNDALERAAVLCDDREGMTKSQLVDLPDDIRALKEPTP